jgi:hypothetical protein
MDLQTSIPMLISSPTSRRRRRERKLLSLPRLLSASDLERWVNKALKEMAYVLLSRYHPKSTENQRISNQALAPGAKDSL